MDGYGYSCGFPTDTKGRTCDLRCISDSAGGPTGGHRSPTRECFLRGKYFMATFFLDCLKVYLSLFVSASQPNQK